MIELRSCALCGCEQWDVLFIRRDRLLMLDGEFRVVKCSRCGLVFINPRPSSEELERFYADEYCAYSVEPHNLNSFKWQLRWAALEKHYGYSPPRHYRYFLPRVAKEISALIFS